MGRQGSGTKAQWECQEGCLQKPKEVACEVSRCTAAVLMSCKGSNGGKDTSWGLQRKEHVRTWKESDREKGYLPSEDRRGKDLPGYGKKAMEQGTLSYPGGIPMIGGIMPPSNVPGMTRRTCMFRGASLTNSISLYVAPMLDRDVWWAR